MPAKLQSTGDRKLPELTFEKSPDSIQWSRPTMHRGVVELCAPASFLADPEEIRQLIECIVHAFDFTVVDYGETEFDPYGITAFAVVGESHVSIHTWPECGYAHVELLTCTPLPETRELRRRFPVDDDYIVTVTNDDE